MNYNVNYKNKFLCDNEIEKNILKWCNQNILAQIDEHETKQRHQLLTIFNGIGEGKTRLLLEIINILKKKKNNPIKSVYIPLNIFLNFNNDNIKLLKLFKSFEYDINLLVGYLIFCFYLKISPIEFLKQLSDIINFKNLNTIFSIYNVLDFIFDDMNKSND